VRDDIAGNMEEWRAFGNVDSTPVINADNVAPLNSAEIQMYWIDAYEDRFTNPGTVFLFGKVLY
jgi:hypothetical protein